MKKIPDPYKMKRLKGPVAKEDGQHHLKVRITTSLDPDVVEQLRQMAGTSGLKYQTLLNQILRVYLFDEDRGLFARLSRLEQAVFRKRQTA